MYPLIEITTVPIQIELKTTHAKLEYENAAVDLELSRDRGGLNIKNRPIQLKLDTFEARNSLSPTLARAIDQQAERGQQAAYEATATYAKQGQRLLKTKTGEELITQFAVEAQMKDVKTNVGIDFLPKGGANISWDKGELFLRYEMDKLNFDWKCRDTNLKYIPGNIEVSVTQRPDVIIEYVGGPIFVPPSAAPDYKPIDVNV